LAPIKSLAPGLAGDRLTKETAHIAVIWLTVARAAPQGFLRIVQVAMRSRW
jgi:hypothetical protein